MGYFPVSYNSRVVNYDRRGFIRLDTDELYKRIRLGRFLQVKRHIPLGNSLAIHRGLTVLSIQSNCLKISVL